MALSETAVVADPQGLSFEDFFERESLALGKALYLVCGDRDEAEELTQEAMSRALGRWEVVRGLKNPRGYVYATALNLHRRRLRRQRYFLGLAPRIGAATPIEEDPDLRIDVLAALRRLPRAQREAVVLFDLVGMPANECGHVLGISEGTARSNAHRGRTRLRELLGGR